MWSNLLKIRTEKSKDYYFQIEGVYGYCTMSNKNMKTYQRFIIFYNFIVLY